MNTKALTIIREFDAPKELVFDAFATAEAMQEWWGPKGSDISVMSFDFKPNGIFHYKMEGQGNIMWGRFKFSKIQRPDLLEFISSFSNEKGEVARAPFSEDWPLEIFNRFSFEEKAGKTILTAYGYPVNHNEAEGKLYEDMHTSMQGGFGGTFDQLDAYLKARFELKRNVESKTPRTVTYLNFDGNTEEAFLFYKSVFKTEFQGKGIQRLGEIPADANHPPLADNLKKMILHVELPITGGHILMGTDAPKEMGFTVTFGTNCYICVEPGSREETKRLYDELSADGVVVDPLADIFLGTYYGSCRDKFGVSWMFSHNNS